LSKFGTNKKVKARFWLWLEPFFRQKSLNPFMLLTRGWGQGVGNATSSAGAAAMDTSGRLHRSTSGWRVPIKTKNSRRAVEANSARTRKSRPDSGLGLSHVFRQKVFKPFHVVDKGLGARGWGRYIFGGHGSDGHFRAVASLVLAYNLGS